MRMRAFLSPTAGDHQMADAKRKRVAGGEPEEGGYVRLTPSVAKFMGGKRYCSIDVYHTLNGSVHNTDDRQGHNSAPLHRKEGTGAHHDPYRDAPTQEQHPHGRTVPAAFRGLRVPGGYNDENIL